MKVLSVARPLLVPLLLFLGSASGQADLAGSGSGVGGLFSTQMDGILEKCNLGGLTDTIEKASAIGASAVASVGGGPPGAPGGSGAGNPMTSMDMDTMATAMEWFAYMQKIAKNTCSESQAQEFDKALSTFDTCAGFNLKEFIEDFWSALIGTEFQCLLSLIAETDLLSLAMPDGTSSNPTSIPEKCAEDLFGSNPLGDVLRNMYRYPDKVLPCFTKLSDAVPDCTFESWPMPLIGSWLKSSTCVVGASTELVDAFCESELKSLDACLPAGEIASDACSSFKQAGCAADTFTLSLAEPLFGAPLPDACLRVAKDRSLVAQLKRYHNFRDACVTEWAGWSAENHKHKSHSSGHTTSANASSSSNEKEADSVVLAQEQQEAAAGKTSSSSGSFFGTFIGGTVFGMLVVALVTYQRNRRKRQTDQRFSRITQREIEIPSTEEFA